MFIAVLHSNPIYILTQYLRKNVLNRLNDASKVNDFFLRKRRLSYSKSIAKKVLGYCVKM